MKESKVLERLLQMVEPSERTPLWEEFSKRFDSYGSDLYQNLKELYGSEDGFLFILQDLLRDCWDMFQERSEILHAYDANHTTEKMWYTSQEMVAGVLYVDLFSGNLEQLLQRIDYIEELGITLLHLMPLFKSPEGESDGGYAVSSYREVDPKIGDISMLKQVIEELHRRGIAVALDFILNHTSSEHIWAKRAIEKDPYYSDFYFIYPDRSEPDQYQVHLRDIFPEVRSGSFTYHEELSAWVWTTFHSYQWDLNYQNPELFRAMAREMSFLANLGIDVLRFDAVAFAWKEKGTSCEGLTKVHNLVRAFRALTRIIAPCIAFLSEAIVAPSDVLSYISTKECELSYNPLLMATSWEALATRDVRLLRKSLSSRYSLESGCTWINYIRCHDDIGWTFDDHDAWSQGIDPKGHRAFLNEFYTGRFPGSFAKGLPFQENEVTGDCRISGTAASLAGLEKGLLLHDEKEIRLTIKKLQMLYGLSATAGGIPLLYIGDELGQLNDYTYLDDPIKREDSRWTHRRVFSWDDLSDQLKGKSPSAEIHAMLKKLFSLRKGMRVLSEGSLELLHCESHHILAFERSTEDLSIIILANFSDSETDLERETFLDSIRSYEDLLTGRMINAHSMLSPWQFSIVQEVTDER